MQTQSNAEKYCAYLCGHGINAVPFGDERIHITVDTGFGYTINADTIEVRKARDTLLTMRAGK